MTSAPDSLRIAFLGNAAWSVPALAAVAESRHQVVFVGTRPDRPGRRGGAPVATPVAQATKQRGLRLYQAERSPELLAPLIAAQPDLLVVVAFGELLGPEVLSVAPAVNLHFSLLPAFRGASPVQSALLEGATRTGISIIALDEGMDTGPVYAERSVDIDPAEDAGSLGERLAELGAAVLVEVLDAIAAGTADPQPQSEHGVSVAQKFTTQDRAIIWNEPADRIVNRVRAFAPAPGAVTTLRDVTLKVLRAEVCAGQGIPGTVIDAGAAEGPVVAAGRDAVRLLRVAPAGRPQMSGADLVRGGGLSDGEDLSRG